MPTYRIYNSSISHYLNFDNDTDTQNWITAQYGPGAGDWSFEVSSEDIPDISVWDRSEGDKLFCLEIMNEVIADFKQDRINNGSESNYIAQLAREKKLDDLKFMASNGSVTYLYDAIDAIVGISTLDASRKSYYSAKIAAYTAKFP